MQGIGAAGVGAHGGKGVAHGGEVDDAGYAGEVLQEDSCGHEADFLVLAGDAAGDVLDVGGGDAFAILAAKEIFEQDSGGNGQLGGVADARFVEAGEAEIVIFSSAYTQLRRCAKSVFSHCFPLCHIGDERRAKRRHKGLWD